jgi:predicted PurR-regulated permease PerM
VSDWSVVFLGVMAVCLVIMTAIQIGVIVVGARIAKQTTAAIDDLRRELKPLSEKVNRIADDAAKAASLAAMQVERLDQMLSSTASRLDDTLGVVQGLMSGPVKGGATAVAVFRAAFAMFREWKGRSQRARTVRDDDEALFVG